MVAIDEAWTGDYGLRRLTPMELCAPGGPLHGTSTCVLHTLQDSTVVSMLGGTLAVLSSVGLVVSWGLAYYDIDPSNVICAIAIMGFISIIVSLCYKWSIVRANNLVQKNARELVALPEIVKVSDTDIDNIVSNNIGVTFHHFDFYGTDVPELWGMRATYAEFLNETDRVMFVLGR